MKKPSLDELKEYTILQWITLIVLIYIIVRLGHHALIKYVL